MDNSSPENFVSFQDFLGLNDEAGREAMARLLASRTGDNSLEGIQKNSDAHYRSARDAGYDGTGGKGSEYQQTGDAALAGLTSYGDFMKSMGDPALRQAALEKVFGGRANAMDSALTGAAGAGQLDATRGQFNDLRHNVDNRMVDAGNRFSEYKRRRASDDAADEQGKANRQTFYNNVTAAAAKSKADRITKYYDSKWASAYKDYDPEGSVWVSDNLTGGGHHVPWREYAKREDDSGHGITADQFKKRGGGTL